MKLDQKYLFLKPDLDQLATFLKELKGQIKTIEAGVGDSREGSESWHDNIRHEEAMRQFGLWQKHYDEHYEIFKRAKIVQSNPSEGVIRLGSQIKLENQNGQLLDLEIGSFLNITKKPGRISYAAPLGQMLLEHRQGETVTGNIAGNKTTYKIIEVR